MMQRNARIYVAGHEGFIGSHIVSALYKRGYRNLLLPRKDPLDLHDRASLGRFFASKKPTHVFLAAQKSGGIMANVNYPADFFYQNTVPTAHLIDVAARSGVKKLIFFGASCMYPKDAPNPIREEAILTGPVEETSRAYALAKLALWGACEAHEKQFGMKAVTVVPATLYGPGANFDPHDSHVLSGLITKFHEARKSRQEQITLWGSGKPRREFLHIADFARACVFLMERDDAPALVNVGTGSDVPIRTLAVMVARAAGYKGKIVFDASKPDGAYRKLLSSKKISRLGWKPEVGLEEGIQNTYKWYRSSMSRRATQLS
jgi:GDP-L-fucose synthase